MGFFSGLARLAGGVLRAVVGVPAAAAAPVAVGAARTAGRLVGRAAPIAAAGAVFGAADLATQAILGGGAAAPSGALAARGGNGRFRTATLVRTVDVTTGETVSEKILQGSPFLMRRDLAIAKRVLRTANKLGSKFSRKRREKSKRSVLLDAIEDKAISRALGVDCPTGSHANG